MDAGESVVIVGSGQGGYQAAASLRDQGFEGRIVLVGDEPGLPYQRPPLSKEYLTGQVTAEAMALRPASFYAERRIETRFGVRAEHVDRAAARVRLDDGTSLAYDHLILATGSRNLRLNVPGMDLRGVVQLRTLADADVVRAQLDGVRRVVIVGAGFIGLEFAAVTVARGIETTVLEAAERPMARALSVEMSGHFEAGHIRGGAHFAFGTLAGGLLGEGGRVTGVEASDGRVFPADLVLVGIGVRPNVELAAEAGLRTDNGIVTDAHLATEDPAISAIGDCAAYPSPFLGGRTIRLESVQNAVDHARCIAARLTGKAAPYRALPWFWSDQGEMRLQIAGLSTPHTASVVRGDQASGAFSVFCFDGEALVGVESVNRSADHMAMRKIMAADATLTAAQASDTSFDLKAFAMAAAKKR